jgi:hypothetical protein
MLVVFAPHIATSTQLRSLIRPGTGLALSVALLFAVCAALRTRTVWPTRTLFAYPPSSLAALIGFAVAALYWLVVPRAWSSVEPAAFAESAPAILTRVSTLLLLAAVGISLIHPVRRAKKSKRQPAAATPTPPGALAASPPDLRDWLATDAPITEARADAFGLHEIATRIVGRLVATPAIAQLPSLAIVGALGSGKTSLCNLVQAQLQQGGALRIRVVRFSAWPFETTAALIAGILESVTGVLSREVGTPLLQSLPRDYVDAIEGVARGWGPVLRAFNTQPTATATLRKIDDVTEVLGIKVVLWIEDLERFGAGAEAQESSGTRERLAPVRALLHQLQELRNVSVAVACTSNLSGFDLEKLARHIEVLKPLDSQTTMTTLDAFRTVSLSEAKRTGRPDWRGKAPPHGHDLRPAARSADPVEAAFRSIGKLPEAQWPGALALLCSTPRTLKQALRDCADFWDEYAGEIDFDHLLTISLLRFGQPAAFGVLFSLADRLRQSQKPSGPHAVQNNPWDELSARLLDKVPDDRIRMAVTTVATDMFGPVDDDVPQGFARTDGVDYWRRYLSRPQLTDGERDTPVLKAIAESTDRIVELCLTKDGAPQVERLGARIEADQVVKLIDGFLDRLQGIEYPDWPDETPPGLMNVWHLALNRARKGRWPSGALLGVLCKHVRGAVPGNLALVEVLLYWFGTSESTAADLLNPDERIAFRREFNQCFVQTFLAKPRALADALSTGPDFLLARLCWGIERVRRPDGSLPFDDWEHFAPTVVEAAEMAPTTVLPQLSYLVTARSEVMRDDGMDAAYRYDSVATRRLFGERDVLSLFVGDVEVRSTLPDTTGRMLALRASAAERTAHGSDGQVLTSPSPTSQQPT